MARRGSYVKGIAKREEILNTALDIVARSGYSRATLRQLARAVDLSLTGLLHYFGTKEQLFIEILRRRDEVDQHGLERFTGSGEDASPPDLAQAVITLQCHNADVPGLVQLYARFSSEATESDHPAHDYFRDRYQALRVQGAAVIRRQQAAGTLPAELDADRTAAIVFALLDGLQTQWMYDPGIDMADHLSYFWGQLSGGAAQSADGGPEDPGPAEHATADARMAPTETAETETDPASS
jgi:AcrR family transcriptional regulator